MPLIEMVLQAQQYIPGIPGGPEQAWATATRSDGITVKSWYSQWLSQTKENSVHGFAANNAMLVYGNAAYQPIVLAGSGSSLKKNWADLRYRDEKSLGRQGIKMVSCLHNFGFMEDRDLMGPDDYYVTLDAGEITLSEVTEGGTDHDKDWYWERTKDRTLIAYTAAYPELIRRWKGRVLWFVTPAGSKEFDGEMKKAVDQSVVPVFSVGGHVLGAAWYFAVAVLGASIPIFIGADYSFGYDRKFHGWQSQYDQKFAGVMPCTDIYGNRVWTWGSYWGFKAFMDHAACGGQGGNASIWINATEGGILGAYPEGNIQQIIQLDLRTAMHMYNRHKLTPDLVKRSGDMPHILL